MTINALDEVEFSEIETDEFYNRTRVFTAEDKKRVTDKIIGKSKGDALIFVRDTEDCKKKDAEKLISQLEDEKIIMFVGKRPKFIATMTNNNIHQNFKNKDEKANRNSTLSNE